MNNTTITYMPNNKQTENLDLKGFRVLVVEDEEDIQNIISFNLEAEGFIVTKSDNGIDAWNKIEKTFPI